MTRELKQVIVYGAFGLLLGAKIVEVLLTRSDTGIIDWWLLLIGVGAAIVHYLPAREQAQSPDDRRTEESRPDREDHDTLVLRDHTHLKRGQTPRRNPTAAARESDDSFV